MNGLKSKIKEASEHYAHLPLLYKRILILQLVIAFIIPIRFESLQSDTFWVLRAGKEFMAGQNVFVDSWSYTADGRYWPNHELLYELYLASVWAVGGVTLAVILNGLLAVVIWLLLTPSLKSRDIPSPAFYQPLVLIIPAFFVFSGGIALRAQSFSLLFLAIVIFLLARQKFLYVPLVILLWVNTHAMFIIGLGAIFAAFVLALVWQYKYPSPKHKKRAGVLLATGVVSTALTFINPLGPGMWSYLYLGLSKSEDKLQEWGPLWLNLPAFIIFCLAIGFTAYFCWRARAHFSTWEAWTSLAIALLLVPLGIYSARIAVFAILACIWPLREAFLAPRQSKKTAQAAPARVFNFIVAIALLFAALNIYDKYEQEKTLYPQDLTSKLEACDGKVYNDYWSGAYLLWYAPDHKVFQDNRFDPYPKEIQQKLTLQLFDWEPYFEANNITCAVTFVQDGMPSPDNPPLEASSWTKTYDKAGWRFYEKG